MPLVVSAQHAALYYRSSSIDSSQRDSSIHKIGVQKLTKYLIIKYTDGTKSKIPKDSVWGFRDNKGHLFRIFKGEPYQIMKRNGLIKYSYYSFIYIDRTHSDAQYSITL
jgi:hypothetical protein